MGGNGCIQASPEWVDSPFALGQSGTWLLEAELEMKSGSTTAISELSRVTW